VAGVLSVATIFSRTIPVLVSNAGLVPTSRHAGWGKTRGIYRVMSEKHHG
jgi:hypothetical protein